MLSINKYEKIFFFLEWLKGSTEKKEREGQKTAGIRNFGWEKCQRDFLKSPMFIFRFSD